MNQQVNKLIMNASDEMMAGPDGIQRTPEEVSARPGPLLRDFLQSLAEQGVTAPDEAALPAAAAEFALYWAPDNGEETP